MKLAFTRHEVKSAPARTSIPAGAAACAALAGNPSFLRSWLASAVKHRCLSLLRDPKLAEQAAEQILANTIVTVSEANG